MLAQNQSALDSVLGTANYDIGHAFGTLGSGGSGLASLGVVGSSSFKGHGASVSSNPQGGGWFGLVAHEIGHQFGAGHSFNGNQSNCGPGREATSAYEPGSGSTLMSYAAICGGDDIQSNEDDYLHSASYEEINTYLQNTPAAAPNSTTATGNAIPTVAAGTDYTIPANTPFTLNAIGSDADAGDIPTYTWEQLDLGPAMNLPLTDNGSSPLFRSFAPSTESSRTFPRLSDLLANNSTAAIGEVLPTTTRSLNFRSTIRDASGGVNSDDILVNVVDTGAAFVVTSPNTAATFAGGTNQTVTWNVAGTDANGINAANVVIALSTDGGLTFPFDLATTADDGSQVISMPNIDTSTARIRVMGGGNVFFDVSDSNFTINANAGAPGITITESDGSTRPVEAGPTDSYVLALNTNPAGNVTITVSAPDDALISANGSAFTTSAILTLNSTAVQPITVMAIDDAAAEGPEAVPISHTVTTSTSATYPVGIPLNQVVAHVYDDELPPLIGVDLDCCGQEGPEFWGQPGFFSDQTNLTRDDGAPTTIDLDFSAPGSKNASTSGPSSSELPAHRPSLEGIDGFVANTNAISATWEDLMPGADYGIYVFGFERRTGDYIQDVTITGATVLPTFTQTVIDGQLQINDQSGSSASSLVSFEKTVAANASGEITVLVSPVGASVGASLAGLAIREILVGLPPVLAAIEASPLDYQEGDGDVAISSTITATDTDSNINGATISISANYIAAEDQLNVNGALPGGITASGAGTDTITLSGSATPSQYQTALRQITYTNSNINPNAALIRTVEIQVDDDSGSSNLLSRNITVSPTECIDHLGLLTSAGRTPGNVDVVISGGSLILFPDANDNGVFIRTDENGNVIVEALGGGTVEGAASFIAFAATNTVPTDVKVISSNGTMLLCIDDVNIGGVLQVLSSDDDDAIELYDVNITGNLVTAAAAGKSHWTADRLQVGGNTTIRSGTIEGTVTVADSRFFNPMTVYTSTGIDSVNYTATQFDSSLVVISTGGGNTILFTDIIVSGGSRVDGVSGTSQVDFVNSQVAGTTLLQLGALPDTVNVSGGSYGGQFFVNTAGGNDQITVASPTFSNLANFDTAEGVDSVSITGVDALFNLNINSGSENDTVIFDTSQITARSTVAMEAGIDSFSSTDSDFGNFTNVDTGLGGDHVVLLRVTSTGTFGVSTKEEDDTVTATSLTMGGAFSVNTGDGADNANVSQSELQQILNIVGDGGTNTVTLATSTVASNANLITVSGSSLLTLDDVQIGGTTQVNLGTLADGLTVEDSEFDGTLIVNGGSGNDLLVVTNTDFDAQANIGTGDGGDDITFTDVRADAGLGLNSGNDNDNDTLTLNQLQVLLKTTIDTRAGVDSVSLISSTFGTQTFINTGADGDNLTLLATSFTGTTSLKTLGGNDTISGNTVNSADSLTIDSGDDDDLVDWTLLTTTAAVTVQPGFGNDAVRFTNSTIDGGSIAFVPSGGNNVVDLLSNTFRDHLTVASNNGNLAVRIRQNTMETTSSFVGGLGSADTLMDNGTNNFGSSPTKIRFEGLTNTLIDELVENPLGLAFP